MCDSWCVHLFKLAQAVVCNELVPQKHALPGSLELPTLRLTALRSNQLSYETFALVAAFPDGLLLCFESVARSACIIAMSRGLCNREQPHWIGNSPPSSAGRAQGP